ncbi:MAG TPA: NAD-dependent epimerase/dehydratase family protein [Kiloniellales bacterium]|nr:NAD-dependent epimerase/dehydratase family protein [Kiloniellales bacterium]
MTILVTGVAGFIGAAVAEGLLARGEAVLGLDSLNAYYDPRLKRDRLARLERRRNFRFLQLDLAKRGALAALQGEDFAAILHLAAQAGVRHSLKDPWSYLASNVDAHLEVLEFARHLPRLKHLVYASSSSVYGASTKLPASEDDRVHDPLSLYAVTKRTGELMSRCYARLYGLPQTGLRLFTVYGPWGRPDMSPFIFARAILEGRPLTLYDQGRMRRDYTAIDDVVPGVLAALDCVPQADATGVPHRIYNLGSDSPIAVNDFLAELERLCGRKALIEPAEASEAEPESTWADIGAARRDLGFAPRTPLAEGLARFVAWFRDYYRL